MANDDVGKRFAVGIADVGYMLAEDQQNKYQRGSIPLDPQRLATSETPFAEAVERYTFAAFTDWRGGRGQKRRSVVDSDPTRYFESLGVDPFEPDGLKLLHKAEEIEAETGDITGMAVVGDVLYYVVGRVLKSLATPASGAVTIGTFSADVSSFTTDGRFWYAAIGTNVIHRGTNSIGTWVTLGAGKNVKTIGFGVGRVLVAYESATGAETFSTLADDGSEEIPDGRITLPDGWVIVSFAAGSGYVYFAANAEALPDTNKGEIYAWDVTSYTPYVVDELEHEAFHEIWYHQGQLFARARRQLPSGDSNLLIYRSVIENQTGSLSRFLVADLGGDVPSVDYATAVQPTFAAYGPLVFFAWPNIEDSDTTGTNGSDGVGAFDLETSGVARFWKSGDGDTNHQMIGPVVWEGRVTWGSGNDGIHRVNDSTFEASGYVDLSIVDGGSTLNKRFDKVRLRSEVLPANTSVAVASTVDSWASVTNIAAAALAAGEDDSSGTIGVTSVDLGLRLTLATSDGASSPVVRIAQLQFHPTALSDEILVLPIDCSDMIRDFMGTPLTDSGSGRGAARARALQALINTQVEVQDVDWHLTGQVDTFEVESVQIFKTSVYNRHQGQVQLKTTAVVQLRREE